MKFLPLVWAGLNRKKLRTTLTFLSIAVAFLLFGFLGILKTGLTGGVQMEGQDRLVMRHKVSLIMTLPQAYKARVSSLKGVKAVAHQTWFGGIYKDDAKNGIATFPVEPEEFLAMYPEIIVKPEEQQAWLANRVGAIVGRTASKRFGWKIGDRVAFKSPIWGQPAGMEQWEFEVVGIYDGAKKNTDTSGFYFRYDYFEEARQKEKGKVGWYSVRVENPGDAATVAEEIDGLFANSPYETKTEAEGAFMQGFANQIGDIATITMAVIAAVFFTILLVAGNTMAQSVRERTEELGVLKALGFTNGLVLSFVLAESCFIAILGGFAGLGITWAIVLGGNPMPAVLPLFDLPTDHLVTGGLLSIALGLVAGAIPAWQAMNLRISEALRRGG